MDTVDFAYYDIGGVNNIDSLEDCHALCLERPNCFGVVWAKPWLDLQEAKTCWFKSAFRIGSIRELVFGISKPRHCLHSLEQTDGWYRFQDKNYMFIAQTNLYETGMAICKSHGGQLVSLESQEEYMFVRTIAFTLNYHRPNEFSGSYRLGLYKNDSAWTLSNGQTLNQPQINLWCPNEPSSSLSYTHFQLWNGNGFCGDDITSVHITENLVCEASICIQDEPPNLENGEREIKTPHVLRWTILGTRPF
ncbi:uncharacterized protein LOC131878289 [Tigriopus californicus]|uniref:uncharacterized protein LOC131878289 n=1 Tax=Tigriopus californicus TaxID=6832 RepID=UPI0027DA59A7|nr:uncharacterized protein LOC131878289 [Tigriopus californicus]